MLFYVVLIWFVVTKDCFASSRSLLCAPALSSFATAMYELVDYIKYVLRTEYVHKPFDIQKDEREHLGIEHRINTLIVVLSVWIL